MQDLWNNNNNCFGRGEGKSLTVIEGSFNAFTISIRIWVHSKKTHAIVLIITETHLLTSFYCHPEIMVLHRRISEVNFSCDPYDSRNVRWKTLIQLWRFFRILILTRTPRHSYNELLAWESVCQQLVNQGSEELVGHARNNMFLCFLPWPPPPLRGQLGFARTTYLLISVHTHRSGLMCKDTLQDDWQSNSWRLSG